MIETMTLHQASKYLRDKGLSLCSDTLADGLEQGVYPFGVCIRTDRSPGYFRFSKRSWMRGLRSGRSKHGRLHIDAGDHRRCYSGLADGVAGGQAGQTQQVII